MKITSTKILLFALAFAIGYIIIDSIRDNYKENKEADAKIEQNEKEFDNLETQENEERENRSVIDQELDELEDLKNKPHGKKDFTDNTSVTNAERYFARRYRTDTIKDR